MAILFLQNSISFLSFFLFALTSIVTLHSWIQTFRCSTFQLLSLICASLQQLNTFVGYVFYGQIRKKNRKYSLWFKVGVITDVREHHLEYQKTARRNLGAETQSEEQLYRNRIKKAETYIFRRKSRRFDKKRRGKFYRSEKCLPKLEKKQKNAKSIPNC